ncbi:zinc finger MYM-type protein 1-like [Tachypleus tridentatus]|uniref:zinc finger MYM-type protein 1-like n=1 Tax=Tachypleus tridentatus TaxID=6853 RepID=UPI003FD0AB14
MQHYLLPKKKQRVDGPTNTCGASEEDSGDRDGFRNCKKTTTLLKSHDNSAGHKFAMQAWAEFKLQKIKGARIQHALDKKLSGPANDKYTHDDIQNEQLDIITGMIRKDISKEVMEAEHFALIVDETKDVSKEEQLSIVCYDGAAVMSGHISGIQVRFRREVSQAVYVHCYAHRFNLVLVDCVHNVQAAAEFFVTIQKLYKFFSTSVVHEEFLKVQKELEPVNQYIELKRLSNTRWAYQHAACLAVKRTFPAIVTILKRLVEGDNVYRVTESKGLCILLDQ